MAQAFGYEEWCPGTLDPRERALGLCTDTAKLLAMMLGGGVATEACAEWWGVHYLHAAGQGPKENTQHLIRAEPRAYDKQN